MNGLTSRCISFTQGNKDPLQRVNYAFGLVLGVDEFVDEQCYFLEKEYQHNRALHGYGTVSGLLVKAEDKGNDIEVQVEKGIGIDQYGRVFIVRNLQCASLPGWIADQELQPGDQTIYVVARYAECETGLVPIAGEPCSTGEELAAASRIEDIFEIELTLDPPDHSARDAVVNLSEFLSRFRADPTAADLGDLGSAASLVDIIGPQAILDSPADFRIRINQAVEAITGTPGATIISVLPLAVEDLLNDIFTYWITVVRPTLKLDLIDPDARDSEDDPLPPAEILLAKIDLVIPDNTPLDFDTITIDNSTRPYLMHTQLIQELFDVPDLAGEGAAAPNQEVREWVTIADVSPQILRLWFHIDEDLDLVPNDNIQLLRVRTDGSIETINITGLAEDIPGNDVGRYVRLRAGVSLANGDFLLLRFNANQIQVGAGGSLADFITNEPYTYPNYSSGPGRLFAFHVVDRGRAGGVSEDRVRELIRELTPPQEPVIPFVTITPLTDGNVAFAYELWFHLDGVAEVNKGVIEQLLNEENIVMLVESEPNIVQQVPIELGQRRDNVWEAFPSFGPNIPTRSLVRFAFSLDEPIGIRAFDPNSGGMDTYGTLREYIDKTGQRLEGHLTNSERFGEALVIYVREQASAQRIEI